MFCTYKVSAKKAAAAASLNYSNKILKTIVKQNKKKLEKINVIYYWNR